MKSRTQEWYRTQLAQGRTVAELRGEPSAAPRQSSTRSGAAKARRRAGVSRTAIPDNVAARQLSTRGDRVEGEVPR